MSSNRRLITKIGSECSRVYFVHLHQVHRYNGSLRMHRVEEIGSDWSHASTTPTTYEPPLKRQKALPLSVPPVERDDKALFYISRALNRSKLGILSEVLGPTPPFTDLHVHSSHCIQLLEAPAPLLSGASPVTVGYDCNICQVIGQSSRPAVDAVMDHF
ncbi:hypothetical protein CC79DRAFT_78968 [Sarocladium strictum]